MGGLGLKKVSPSHLYYFSKILWIWFGSDIEIKVSNRIRIQRLCDPRAAAPLASALCFSRSPSVNSCFGSESANQRLCNYAFSFDVEVIACACCFKHNLLFKLCIHRVLIILD